MHLKLGPLPPLETSPYAVRVHEVDVAWEMEELQEPGTESTYLDERLILQGINRAYPLIRILSKKIQELPYGDVLLIRLDHVCAMAGFAEAVVENLVCGNTPETRLVKEKIVVLVNPDIDTTLAIHRALEARNDACMVLNKDGTRWSLEYIGSIQKHLFSVLKYICDHRNTTSRDVAEEFGRKMGDIGRRLKELYEDGMIRRKPEVNPTGKLTFAYSFFHPILEYFPDTAPSELLFQLYVPPTFRLSEHLSIAA